MPGLVHVGNLRPPPWADGDLILAAGLSGGCGSSGGSCTTLIRGWTPWCDRTRQHPQRAAWVDALPDDPVVASTVRESTRWAVSALGTPGPHSDLRSHFRESHAFVGVKGAALDSAVEGAGPRPIALSVGGGWPEEYLGGRPDWT